MYHWLSKGYDEFWLILNYSKVVGDINTKFSPLNVPISIQLCTKFEALSYAQNGFPAKTILNFKRAWRAHFLSHAHQTQEICCFSADVRIILLSFFKLSNCLKVGKNVGAFLSRCSELLGQIDKMSTWTLDEPPTHITWTNVDIW